MKTIAASALIALSGLFGAAYASAAPANASVVAHFGNDSHGHNYSDPKNTDAVTVQGPNNATPTLRDTVKTALNAR